MGFGDVFPGAFCVGGRHIGTNSYKPKLHRHSEAVSSKYARALTFENLYHVHSKYTSALTFSELVQARRIPRLSLLHKRPRRLKPFLRPERSRDRLAGNTDLFLQRQAHEPLQQPSPPHFLLPRVHVSCHLVSLSLSSCIYMCIHVRLFIYAYTHTHMYIYVHTNTHTHMYICVHTNTHTHLYVCIYICIHAHTYTHTHKYIIHLYQVHLGGNHASVDGDVGRTSARCYLCLVTSHTHTHTHTHQYRHTLCCVFAVCMQHNIQCILYIILYI
jgi:hypothetical protein